MGVVNKMLRAISAAVSRAKTVPGLPFEELGSPVRSMPANVAMKVAAVYRCVSLIAEGAAKLPLNLLRYDKSAGYYKEDTGSSLYSLLRYKPSRRLNAYDMLRAALAQKLLYGNAYIYPIKNGYGDVVALVLLAPDTVTYDELNDNYYISDPYNGINETCGSDRIIHLRNISIDGGRTGLSTIKAAALSLNISVNADKETNNLFKSGGRQKGIISGENGMQGFGKMQDNQLDDVRTRVETELASGRNIITLPGEMKFSPFSMTPADVQLLENKQFTVKEIGRFFSVSPSLLYESGGSTYNNGEMEQLNFLNQTLSPYLTQIENEFLVKLIPRDDWSRYKIVFDREPLYNTDLTTQAAYMTATITAGVYTVNDWRRKLGRVPVDGGDTPVVSANVITLQERLNAAGAIDKKT